MTGKQDILTIEQGLLTIEEEGSDPLHLTPTLTCEAEGQVLILAVRSRLGHRSSIHLTRDQAWTLAHKVHVMASKLPLIRIELIRPIYDSLAGVTLNQREADHLIERIKTRVRE